MFGDKLRELRKNKKLSQEELGKLFDVGSTTVSNWEKNITQPPFEVVKKLAEYFGVSTDYLFGLNDDDINRLRELNRLLRETNLIKGREMTLSEFKKAIEIVDILSKDKEKDTNEE